MLSKISQYWSDYGFEIVLGVSVVFLIIVCIVSYFKNDKGTWDKFPKIHTQKKQQSKAPKDSKGELECRRVLQKIFNKPFDKDRPDFLRNPVTGNTNNLEIDCYDKQLRLGVEYQGQQHYKFISFFHKNKEAFHNQKYRDEMKRVKCRENGITLIEVPYTVPIENIERFLLSELKRCGYV